MGTPARPESDNAGTGKIAHPPESAVESLTPAQPDGTMFPPHPQAFLAWMLPQQAFKNRPVHELPTNISVFPRSFLLFESFIPCVHSQESSPCWA